MMDVKDFKNALTTQLACSRSRVDILREQSAAQREQTYRVLIPRNVRDKISCTWSRMRSNSLYTQRGGMKYVSSDIKVDGLKRIPFASAEDHSAPEKARLPQIDVRYRYDDQGRMLVKSTLFHDRLSELAYERDSYRERTITERDSSRAKLSRELFDMSHYPAVQEARSRTPAFSRSMKACERQVQSRASPKLPQRQHSLAGNRAWSLLRGAHAIRRVAWTSRDHDSQAVGYIQRCMTVLGRPANRRTIGEKTLLVTWLGSSVPFLSNLSFRKQLSITDFMTVRKFRAGRAVYEHGSRGSDVHFVVTGRLTSRHGVTGQVTNLNPGDVFGGPVVETSTHISPRVGRFGRLVRRRVLSGARSSLFDSLLVTRTTTVKAIEDTAVVAVKLSIVTRYTRELQ